MGGGVCHDNEMIAPYKLFGRLGNSMFQYAFMVSHARDNDIDYYFQDEWFFRNNAEAVRALFSSDIPPKTDAIAIHVRRGDYVNNSFYIDLMETDYYEKAMALFPGQNFLVFSDDIEWCKKQKIFKGCKFFHEDEINDMNKMASCKGHIVANSSFSWWGAWLSPTYPDNKIVCPNKYYPDDVIRSVFPEHWTRINI